MISAELYRQGRPVVIIQREIGSVDGAWARLQTALTRGIVGGSTNRMDVRVDVFLAELAAFRDVRTLFRQELTIGPVLDAQLRSLASDRRARENAIATVDTFDPSILADELKRAGFIRELKSFQLENLAAIIRLPHGADFSVPGAGKTTVALANFALGRARGYIDRLLVIGPLAAFQSWKDDSAQCLKPPPKIAVHGGPDSVIPEHTEILLTNYNRVAADYDRIRAYVSQRPTQVILDEAHRIKRGSLGVQGRAVLDLAYAAKRRDVLTGTPAPQGAFDLIALVRFLYPGQDQQIMPSGAYQERDGREDLVLAATSKAIAKYFVRTPKSRLNLPPTKFKVELKPMGAIQQAIYDALVGRYRGPFQLKTSNRREFDRLGRIVMYLLEAATNPMLLVAGSDDSDEDGFAHPPISIKGNEPLAELLAHYRDYETPWKYNRIKEIVADAASRRQKVLVWSTFVRNLKALGRELEEFQPAMVHGGIPPEDNAPPGVPTREAELDRFRHDSNCSVLLANPAAAGEGVSLHHWCHHAVYLDRTFNAGHFLQSQDRIHRLGLDENRITTFTILLSSGSIDQSVDGRLREKVTALSRLMNDPGLVQVALPEPDENHEDGVVFADDMHAVAAHLMGKSAYAP